MDATMNTNKVGFQKESIHLTSARGTKAKMTSHPNYLTQLIDNHQHLSTTTFTLLVSCNY
jgi:hypothetical protein